MIHEGLQKIFGENYRRKAEFNPGGISIISGDHHGVESEIASKCKKPRMRKLRRCDKVGRY
jgi:hypothetical protein